MADDEHTVCVAPVAGRVAWLAPVGEVVAVGRPLAVVELMKLEHPVTADHDVEVRGHEAGVDEQVDAGTPLLLVAASSSARGPTGHEEAAHEPADQQDGHERGGHGQGGDVQGGDVQGGDEPTLRSDVAALRRRRAQLADDARSGAVARRHDEGMRTARENVDDLVDEGSFVEYGGLVVAQQRARRSLEELRARTPADGVLTGTATVGVHVLGPASARTAVVAYDATVLAGTQGHAGHLKLDRLLRLAADHRLPVALYAEGGGGRPGDTDTAGASWLHAEAFHLLARLHGDVATVAVVAGSCFAGNAALAGACDVLVATEGASLGMAGPAMIAGGGLGGVAAADVGPVDRHATSGTVDVVVEDEAAATAVARHLLVLAGAARHGRRVTFAAAGRPAPASDTAAPDTAGPDTDQGTGPEPTAVEDGRQAALREVVPADGRTAYDMRPVVATLLDEHSVVELRAAADTGMVTALGALAGRPVGVLANDLAHLGGAIDARGARDAADFLRLCDRWGLPVVVLCDTPGFMVGPEAEAEGTVRAAGELFVAGAALRQPIIGVVTRRAVGLGAQAMLGGHTRVPLATLCWPTAELAPMGVEGAVRLGQRRELEAIEEPQERAAAEAAMVAEVRATTLAVNVAEHGEVDDVIDPATTRARLVRLLGMA